MLALASLLLATALGKDFARNWHFRSGRQGDQVWDSDAQSAKHSDDCWPTVHMWTRDCHPEEWLDPVCVSSWAQQYNPRIHV